MNDDLTEYEILNDYQQGHVLMKFTLTKCAIYMHPALVKVDVSAMRVAFLNSAESMVVYDAISIDSKSDVILLGDVVAEVRRA